MANRSLITENNQAVQEAKLFVVGAGGIGCELLKNLILAGFRHIKVIDLDTIDVSNLNRQFLFQKQHVGQSKSLVAKESVLRLCPNADITAIHDSIFNPKYNMEYFKQFDLVLNALDNRSARNHVNRMCLAANIPLVESGSAGYLGQVSVIKRGATECYECSPAPRQKSFPGCTIRNTPSELIHCIVWAKYLFNQLFGEEDADQDVSPDTADPEATGEKKSNDSAAANKPIGEFQRKSTREWAKQTNYDPERIFNKLFCTDISYLLSMDKLWEKRTAPKPVSWSDVKNQSVSEDSDFQAVLSLGTNAAMFARSIATLNEKLMQEGNGGTLVWDKDDSAALNFTASAANIRAHIFGINQKSVFEIKSMAGNIIPAIATTNAIVAGLIVLQAVCILSKKFDQCRNVFVRRTANFSKKLLVPCSLDPPKLDCYVCSEKPEITIEMDTNTFSLASLRDKLLKANLGMLAPDVEILDGKGTVLLSSDVDDCEGLDFNKPLSVFGICSGSRLRADDFLQNYDIVIIIKQGTEFEEDETFKILQKTGSIEPSVPSDKDLNLDGNDDDILIEDMTTLPTKKRKLSKNVLSEENPIENIAKRRKLSNDNHDDDLIVMTD